ncbi:MAG: hypothetical protein M3Y72_13585 [Acidobacteriota bacterium]|nr:hypothetical protein [Acidobacteriota bacterium]
MKRAGVILLAMSMTTPPGALFAQDHKSPDLQQHQHPENAPPADAHEPGTNTGRPTTDKNADRSPDTQQDQTDTSSKSKSKKRHKTKNDARQAHGTPEATH